MRVGKVGPYLLKETLGTGSFAEYAPTTIWKETSEFLVANSQTALHSVVGSSSAFMRRRGKSMPSKYLTSEPSTRMSSRVT